MASILNVDKIRRAAGSTDALVIDSGDRITTPTRPAFRARNDASSATSVTGIIVFNVEDFDIGGNYDTSNGRFTAPVAGIYYFCFDALVILLWLLVIAQEFLFIKTGQSLLEVNVLIIEQMGQHNITPFIEQTLFNLQ